jgi:NitT/TauT family transport system substrate-binding protein
MRRRALSVLVLPLVLAVLAAGCGSSSSDEPKAAATEDTPTTVHLGYFPNLTHATAIAGVEKGIFEKALGTDTLKVATFNAGPAAIEALLSGAVDATYIGPSPTINAFVQSHGEAVRIISGATSGGASLVVKPAITSPDDLKGKKLASPQLGNTQDVALRYWLKTKGFETDTTGGGDVSILPQENSQTLDAFKAGDIDGAWVPEPWATRLVQEGGGKVLVDEADEWSSGEFVTTQLIVRTDFLEKHPAAVKRLLEGQVEANAWVNAHPEDAQTVVNDGIAKITGKTLAADVITAAWKNLTFTDDPIASSLRTAAKHAEEVGLLDKVDLTGIYELKLLNEVLEAKGETPVKSS